MTEKWQQFFNYVAFSISAILSPYIAAAIFITIVVYRYAQNLNQFLPWMLTFFLFAIIVPGFYILWLLETKKIQDIHMAKLSERKIPFLVGAISAIIGAILLYYLDAARPVFIISVIYAVNSTVLALITQSWKISVHTGTFASIATVAVVVFGVGYWWLYLCLIPLAWARIFRRRHTIWQTVVGAILVTFLTLGTFWFFGYL